jgi:hypothetical protein
MILEKKPLDPKFYIFDLDGTLTLTDHRQHFLEGKDKDWDGFFKASVNDPPNMPVIKVFQLIRSEPGNRVEIWSGRSDIVLSETRDWLRHYLGSVPVLKMRRQGDFTPDDEMKEGWLKGLSQWPVAAFDDRNKVVSMWRRNGIPCFHVAPGDF